MSENDRESVVDNEGADDERNRCKNQEGILKNSYKYVELVTEFVCYDLTSDRFETARQLISQLVR